MIRAGRRAGWELRGIRVNCLPDRTARNHPGMRAGAAARSPVHIPGAGGCVARIFIRATIVTPAIRSGSPTAGRGGLRVRIAARAPRVRRGRPIRMSSSWRRAAEPPAPLAIGTTQPRARRRAGCSRRARETQTGPTWLTHDEPARTRHAGTLRIIGPPRSRVKSDECTRAAPRHDLAETALCAYPRMGAEAVASGVGWSRAPDLVPGGQVADRARRLRGVTRLRAQCRK